MLNTHNIRNDAFWKNGKFDKPTKIAFDYDPVVMKQYDSLSYFLWDYFDDPSKLANIKRALKDKLEKRKFEITDNYDSCILKIDTLFLKEDVEMVAVWGDDESLGDHEQYEVTLVIKGYLINQGVTNRIESDYQFTSEPREGIIFKDMIAYDNSTVNLDIIFNNLLNLFSYECYKVLAKN